MSIEKMRKNEIESKEQPEIYYEISEEFKRIYFTGTVEQMAEIYAQLSNYPDTNPERIKTFKERYRKTIEDFIDKNKRENKEGSLQSTPPPFRLYLQLLKKGSYIYEKMKDILRKLNVSEHSNPIISQMMYNGYSDDPKRQEEQWNEVKKAFESVIKI